VTDPPPPAPTHDDLPAGLVTVSLWLDNLSGEVPNPALWILLDQPLRLALAQGWLIWREVEDPALRDRNRDDLAYALTPRDAVHPLFESMLRDLHTRWRDGYSSVLTDRGVVGGTDLVAPDLEKVIITGPQHVGVFKAGDQIPAHTFITRLHGEMWTIAALARRLPVPGWPPTERDVS